MHFLLNLEVLKNLETVDKIFTSQLLFCQFSMKLKIQ